MKNEINNAVDWFMNLDISERNRLSDKYYPVNAIDMLDLDDDEILTIFKAETEKQPQRKDESYSDNLDQEMKKLDEEWTVEYTGLPKPVVGDKCTQIFDVGRICEVVEVGDSSFTVVADGLGWKMNNIPFGKFRPITTPPINPKPLYKVLNEQRTQGDWKMTQKGNVLISDKIPVADFLFDNSEANAQYTVLSVNNLHILSEALIECISLIERMSVMLKVQPTKFSEYNEAKEALSKIS